MSKPNPSLIRFDLKPYVRPGLNLHQLEQIKEVFDLFDVNQIGLVDPKQIKKTLQSFGNQVQTHSLYQMICDLDAQGSGYLSFEQFIFFLNPNISQQDSRVDFNRVFELFDDEKTGYISISTLRRFALEMHLDLQDVDFEQMIKQADKDEDGKISQEQFYQIMTLKIHHLVKELD